MGENKKAEASVNKCKLRQTENMEERVRIGEQHAGGGRVGIPESKKKRKRRSQKEPGAENDWEK